MQCWFSALWSRVYYEAAMGWSKINSWWWRQVREDTLTYLGNLKILSCSLQTFISQWDSPSLRYLETRHLLYQAWHLQGIFKLFGYFCWSIVFKMCGFCFCRITWIQAILRWEYTAMEQFSTQWGYMKLFSPQKNIFSIVGDIWC